VELFLGSDEMRSPEMRSPDRHPIPCCPNVA
jgi:hypothetical protein